MGLDILMYPERHVAGAWEFAGQLVPDTVGESAFLRPKSIYGTRHYALFAILGRGGRPHAAWEFDSIAPLRGFPDNASAVVTEEFRRYGKGAITPSWLLLEEILSFDWQGKEMLRRAWVEQRVAHLFPDGQRGFPWEAWPADVPMTYGGHSSQDVEVEWTETYAEIAGDFLEETVRVLQGLGSPRDVRVVFWFD
jgi:hypothetical protein